MPLTITSTNNPLIKKIRKLHQKKFREKYNLFIAEGVRCCVTLAKKFTLKHLFITQDLLEFAQEITDNFTIIIVPDHVLAAISTSTTPSGIVSVFAIPQDNSLKNLSNGIVLANITNPGNMGTIIRTAAAMNTPSVVIVDGVDLWHPRVIQATMGAIAHVNLFICDWQTLLDNTKLPLHALVVKDGTPLQQTNVPNSLLVVGNEAHGIPEQWLNDCDKHITLPMPGSTESLNVAIAASIALYLTYSHKS